MATATTTTTTTIKETTTMTTTDRFYVAVDPASGQAFFRSTKTKTYTHAVIVLDEDIVDVWAWATSEADAAQRAAGCGWSTLRGVHVVECRPCTRKEFQAKALEAVGVEQVEPATVAQVEPATTVAPAADRDSLALQVVDMRDRSRMGWREISRALHLGDSGAPARRLYRRGAAAA